MVESFDELPADPSRRRGQCKSGSAPPGPGGHAGPCGNDTPSPAAGIVQDLLSSPRRASREPAAETTGGSPGHFMAWAPSFRRVETRAGYSSKSGDSHQYPRDPDFAGIREDPRWNVVLDCIAGPAKSKKEPDRAPIEFDSQHGLKPVRFKSREHTSMERYGDLKPALAVLSPAAPGRMPFSQ